MGYILAGYADISYFCYLCLQFRAIPYYAKIIELALASKKQFRSKIANNNCLIYFFQLFQKKFTLKLQLHTYKDIIPDKIQRNVISKKSLKPILFFFETVIDFITQGTFKNMIMFDIKIKNKYVFFIGIVGLLTHPTLIHL